MHLADEVTPLWRLTEEALGAIGLPPPFWAFAWAGGQGLARYLLDHPETVRSRTVLDFATGSGLVAIAAGRAGAACVAGSDLDRFAAAAFALNAAVNGVSVSYLAQDLLEAPPPNVDVVLAGDVFYERPMAVRILPWLEAAQARGALVLVGDPGRSYFPKARFERLATFEVAVSRELEDDAVKRTGVYALKPDEETGGPIGGNRG